MGLKMAYRVGFLCGVEWLRVGWCGMCGRCYVRQYHFEETYNMTYDEVRPHTHTQTDT